MSTNVVVPTVGESIQTVILSRWLVEAGQPVKKGQGVAEIDSDKASLEVPAPADGILGERLVAEGEEVAIGAVIGRISEGSATEAPKAEAKAEPKAETPKAEAPKAEAPNADAPKAEAKATAKAEGQPKAGPAVRQAADQAGVDLANVAGSGKHGQIVKSDLAAATAKPAAQVPSAPAPTVAEPADRVQRVAMSPLRRTVARRLIEATQTTAMLTTFNEIDLSAAMAMRKKYQDAFVEKYGVKLGFMSVFTKAVIEGLKAFPSVNAEIQGTDILYKRYYNISIAVSAPKGLVVPVLRDADKLSFAETEKAIAALGTKARDNKLTPADFADGTFTISNGGVFGSWLSTPILNPPQVGILGMHNIVEKPVARDGQVVIRPIMAVALTYDHRIIDGREAVGFLVRVKDCVEAPERMLFEV